MFEKIQILLSYISANEENSMVQVSCDEPIVTTTAPKFYTKAIENSGNGNGRSSVLNTGYGLYHSFTLYHPL